MSDIDEMPVAGNGLLNRRLFLQAGAAGTAALLTAQASAEDLPVWMRTPGAGMSESGAPSRYESELRRPAIASQPGTTGTGVSRTPLEHLDGIITPSRLHFERHHSGIPDIDPDRHTLIIHGLVERPLSFSMDALARYPSVSRIQFLECSGNSGAFVAPEPVQTSCSELHGLVSCSEWGGVPLSALLAETGVKAGTKWIVASGADAAKMSRSVPLDKIMDDAIVALYQNGEPLRPSNGYPMRLFLPGWEGNMSVKWLHTIKLVEQPAMTKDETSKYSDLQDNGELRLFTFPMGVKSVITSPSPGLKLGSAGVYRISGIAWSAAGKIRRVEVSADGGKSWADAALDEHVLPQCLTRFRSAWRWNGGPAVILSRATDEAGNVQPTRAVVLQGRAVGTFYHYNGIQAWQVNSNGEVHNVYA
jgi:sulfane dehydrogenase subunit SoxC